MNRDRWRGVELRHLAALVAIENEGTFRAAADELGYVQSAITQQMQSLERIVGATLVDRASGPRQVSLTAEGRLLLPHARDILARLAAAKADLAGLRDDTADTVAVGIRHGLTTVLAPRIMPAFAGACPGAGVVVTESVGDEPILAAIEKGRLDLGIVTRGLRPCERAAGGPFAWCELVRSPPVLVVAAASDLAVAERRTTLAELGRRPVIARESCPLSGRLEQHLRVGRGDAGAIVRTTSARTAQELAAAGVGVATMPRLEADADDPRTALIDLSHLLPDVVVGLVWHRDRLLGAAAETFGETARTACRGLGTVAAARTLAA